MARIDRFLERMNDEGASDLHMVAGQQPVLRIRGDMEWIKSEKLENEELREMLFEICPEEKVRIFEETGDIDFGYEIEGAARYRCNYFEQKRGVGAVFRLIPGRIKTVAQLGLPPIISQLSQLRKGFVLVTGPTGSGKSTTLAAIIDECNRKRKDHILTIEDPIEFIHHSQKCMVNQREVGTHTSSFGAALRGAFREDPDIIMIGEMRDLETVSLALEAAMTGHLVLGTLHTLDAMTTVDRIVDMFPVNQQSQVRVNLADSLQAVVSQILFKRIDRKARCVALGIMVATPAVRNLIREGKSFQILSVMQTGKRYGMQLLDDAIEKLLVEKKISASDAYANAIDKNRFVEYL